MSSLVFCRSLDVPAIGKHIDASHVFSNLVPASRKDGGEQTFVQAIEECIPQSCIFSKSRSGQERNGDFLGSSVVMSSGHT